MKRFENADHSAEQPDEGRGRADGAERPQVAAESGQRNGALRAHGLGGLLWRLGKHAQAATENLAQWIARGLAERGGLRQIAFFNGFDHAVLERLRLR